MAQASTIVREGDDFAIDYGVHRERVLREETRREAERLFGPIDDGNGSITPDNAVSPSTPLINPQEQSDPMLRKLINLGIPQEQLEREAEFFPEQADARLTFTKQALALPKQILENVQEIPGQAVAGGVEAINETIQTLEDLDTFFTEIGAPLPFLQTIDPQGEFNIQLLSPEEKLFARAAGILEAPQLPNIAEADTPTGNFVRGTTQFLSGFVPALRAVRGLKGAAAVAPAGSVTEGVAAGALASVVAFDPNEDRLLTYLNSFPALADIIPDYLADNNPENEAEWEGRIKNAVSSVVGDIAIGAPLGILTSGLIKVFKAYKAKQQVSKKPMDPVEVEQIRQDARESAIDNLAPISEDDYNLLLGDPERAELFFKVRKDLGEAEERITKPTKTEDRFGRTFISGKAGVTEKQDDIFINMARLDATGDIKELLQQTVDAEAKFIQKKRGGKKVTLEQMAEASEDELKNLGELLGREPGPMSAAKMIAARKWLVASVNNLKALARNVQTPGSKTPDADIMAMRRGMALHYAIQSEVLAAQTEVARALSSFKVVVGTDLDRSKQLFELIEQSGGAKSTKDLAQAIVDMADNDKAVSKFASDVMQASRWDAAHQFWMNNVIGLKTQAINLLGNGSMALYSIPESMMNAAFSQTVGSGQIQFAETTARAFGMIKGIRDSIRLTSRQVLRERQDPEIESLLAQFNSQSRGAQKIEGMERGNLMTSEVMFGTPGGRWGAAFDWMGRLFNISLSALKTGDNWFKMIGYNMEKYALAKRISMSEGLDQAAQNQRFIDLVNNPTPNLRSSAINVAHYQTFTNIPEKGTVARAFRDRGVSFRSISTGDIKFIGDVPVGKFILPFLNTPTNVFARGLERTPLALQSNRLRADIAAGGVRRDQAWGRIMLGTALMLHIADMTQEGTLTGPGPENPELKKTWRALGKRPWTATLPNGRTFDFSRMDPISLQIQMGTMFGEMVNNMDEEDANFSTAAMAVAFSEVVASKSYMNSMLDFMAAVDPENYRQDPAGIFRNVLTGFFPPLGGIFRDIEQGIDPQVRITRTGPDDPGLIPGVPEGTAVFLRETLNKIQSKIPGWSSSLPLYLDLWGEPITNASGYGMLWDALSPIYSKVFKPDELEKIILDNQIPVFHVPRVITQGLSGLTAEVTLLPEEYKKYQGIAGKALRKTLMKNLPLIKAAPGAGPEGGAAILIKKFVSQNRAAAREEMIKTTPRIQNKLRQRLTLKVENLRPPVEQNNTAGKPASTMAPQKQTVSTQSVNDLIGGKKP